MKNDDVFDNIELAGKLHVNSYGEKKGKGLAVYFRDASFEAKQAIKDEHLQVSVLSSPEVDIIVVYRS